LAALRRHAWPGNVRELRNVMERAVALSEGSAVEAKHLLLDDRPQTAAGATPTPAPSQGGARLPREMRVADSREQILDALSRCDGNQTRAAELLGVSRRTLVARIAEYGIPRPRKG
jgi:DNA-binding NtrC family response regulator